MLKIAHKYAKKKVRERSYLSVPTYFIPIHEEKAKKKSTGIAIPGPHNQFLSFLPRFVIEIYFLSIVLNV